MTREISQFVEAPGFRYVREVVRHRSAIADRLGENRKWCV